MSGLNQYSGSIHLVNKMFLLAFKLRVYVMKVHPTFENLPILFVPLSKSYFLCSIKGFLQISFGKAVLLACSFLSQFLSCLVLLN